MNIYLIVALRAAALALNIAGDTKTSGRMYALADGVESGQVTEEHMRVVAEKLKAGPITDADWDDVDRRIAADRDRLHSP